MVLLNTGLCLSSIEIASLKQGKSIVAAPRRFIAPGKRFLLVPSQELDDSEKDKLYRPEALSLFKSGSKSIESDNLAWAKCEFCQHITGSDNVELIEQLSLWNKEALETYLRNKGNLFLAFLRVFDLSQSTTFMVIEERCDSQLLNQLIPLPDYFDVSDDSPTLTYEEFQDSRDIFINLQVERSQIVIPKAVIGAIAESRTVQEKTIEEKDILDSLDWITKIAKIGNSSDGNTFERLVRQSFVKLGFQNSGRYADANLDPKKLGGSGGLDFYCDIPYSVVGECKATKTQKIRDNGSGPAAQLIKLGNKILENHYQECIKLIVAAGALTEHTKQTAKNNEINVLRPETLQHLIELKNAYPHSFNLDELRPVLADAPFSEEADQEVRTFIDGVWEKMNIRSLLVETVKKICSQDQKPACVGDIRASFNAVHAGDGIPTLRTKQETRDILLELSSPFTGYLGLKTHNEQECFFFLRELEIKT